MAIYREDIIDIDLGKGSLDRTFMCKVLGEADLLGDKFGIRVLRDGQPVNLDGVSVTGQFIRADGYTVELAGEPFAGKSGSICWVILSYDCYIVPGVFKLIIKLTHSGVTTTARIVDGTVTETVIGEIVDPGGVIPDLANWTALVERAEAAAATIESFDISVAQITGTRYRIGVVDVT